MTLSSLLFDFEARSLQYFLVLICTTRRRFLEQEGKKCKQNQKVESYGDLPVPTISQFSFSVQARMGYIAVAPVPLYIPFSKNAQKREEKKTNMSIPRIRNPMELTSVLRTSVESIIS